MKAIALFFRRQIRKLFGLDQASRVTIDVSAFKNLTGQAIHHWLEGRLQDAPKPGEALQIARFKQGNVRFDGGKLEVNLPQRTVSCIEIHRF